MNPRLVRAVRWALACGWLGSLVWLAGCVIELLGWRGPGAVFVAWSAPSLPLFVATAEFCGRRRYGLVSPLVSATVVAWLSAMWWSVTTAEVPRSPWAFGAAGVFVALVALTVIVWQGVIVWSWRPAAPQQVSSPARRLLPRAARQSTSPVGPDPGRDRRSSVATLARAG